jgi:hypothetical protein
LSIRPIQDRNTSLSPWLGKKTHPKATLDIVGDLSKELPPQDGPNIHAADETLAGMIGLWHT